MLFICSVCLFILYNNLDGTVVAVICFKEIVSNVVNFQNTSIFACLYYLLKIT